MSKSMLLFLAHIWYLKQRNLDRLESAQLPFYKRLYSLPSCTPGYAIRIKFNSGHVTVSVFQQVLNWVIKILEIGDTRLPKI